MIIFTFDSTLFKIKSQPSHFSTPHSHFSPKPPQLIHNPRVNLPYLVGRMIFSDPMIMSWEDGPLEPPRLGSHTPREGLNLARL